MHLQWRGRTIESFSQCTFAPAPRAGAITIAITLASLFVSGALAAHAGGAPLLRGAIRVGFWGAIAMAASYLIGNLFDVRA